MEALGKHTFSASGDDELSFTKGDKLKVIVFCAFIIKWVYVTKKDIKVDSKYSTLLVLNL